MSASLAALTLAVAAAGASADPQDSAAPEQETVIVTAAAVPGGRADLVQSVTLIDRGAALAAASSGGLGEALAGTPGVRASFFGPNASRPVIRGLGDDRIRILSNGLSHFDASAASPDHAPAVEALDARRIEILRGPAALRYGGNALGGVINVLDGLLAVDAGGADARPRRDLHAGLSSVNDGSTLAGRGRFAAGDATLALDASTRVSGDYDIPGFAQSAALRAVTGDDTAGTIANSGGQTWSAGAGAGWRGAGARASAALRRIGSEYGIPGEDVHIELEQTRLEGLAGWSDAGPFEDLAVSAAFVDYTHSEIEDDGEVGTRFDNQGGEIRVEGRLREVAGWTALAGAQWNTLDLVAEGDEAFLPPVDSGTLAAFLTGRRGFTSAGGMDWGLEAGVRLERRDYATPALSRDFQLANVSAGLHVAPVEGLRLSLLASRVERAPTEAELFADGPHAATGAYEVGDPDLDPERVVHVEAGLRWTRGGFEAEGHVWRAGFDGFVAFAPTGAIQSGLPEFAVTQADAVLSGFELRLGWTWGERGGWRVSSDLSADAVRGRYSDGGGDVPRIPPLSLTLGLDAQSGRHALRAEYVRVNRQNRVAAFELPTDGADLVNASWRIALGDPDDGATLRLEARNLTDAEWREHVSTLKDVLPRPGRSLRVSLDWSF